MRKESASSWEGALHRLFLQHSLGVAVTVEGDFIFLIGLFRRKIVSKSRRDKSEMAKALSTGLLQLSYQCQTPDSHQIDSLCD